ncbi:MAG: hypothetical protein AB7F50_05520 [Fimbriimonadaceae bacterium]
MREPRLANPWPSRGSALRYTAHGRAWRVRFGHHHVDIDAATGQVLDESLGRKFPN